MTTDFLTPARKPSGMTFQHCIYHGDCPDGFTAAWLVWRDAAQHPCSFTPASYTDVPPFWRIQPEDNVIIVDYSYPRQLMLDLADACNQLVIIDHHKTAEADLMGIENEADNITCVFDMNRSGAGLAWSYFWEESDSKSLVAYVEDRDLWNWELPDSRSISAYIGSLQHNNLTWSMLATRLFRHEERSQNYVSVVMAGEAVLNAADKIIASLVKNYRHLVIEVDHGPVHMAPSPYAYGSEVAGLLAVEGSYGVYYVDKEKGRKYGLRSLKDDSTIEGGYDVSRIAKELGGGGHRNAASFFIPWDETIFSVRDKLKGEQQ
jgi:oligoribonuclease NrnB/cAMP/cGMP phosphodiesterase (DHH superfamily)